MSELLRLTGVSRRFSGLQALRDVNLSVAHGEVLGLIGPRRLPLHAGRLPIFLRDRRAARLRHRARALRRSGAVEAGLCEEGDTSAEGMLEKARFVLDVMERRMSAFGASWRDTTDVQLCTVHDIYSFLENELGRRGVFRNGLTWHFNRPPVEGLDFEMDCRCVRRERVV